MTKKKIFLTIIIAILVVIGSVIFYKYRQKEENETYDYIVDVSYSDIVKLLEERKTFALLITQDGCIHCENFYPVVGKVSNEYKVKIYHLNLTKMSEKESQEFNKIAIISGTPTTIFYENGEEITTLNRINGETSKEALISRLEKTGIIKEK